jgi:hypothetical protein
MSTGFATESHLNSVRSFKEDLISVFGNNYQYWHDPVILARRNYTQCSSPTNCSLSKSISEVDLSKGTRS